MYLKDTRGIEKRKYLLKEKKIWLLKHKAYYDGIKEEDIKLEPDIKHFNARFNRKKYNAVGFVGKSLNTYKKTRSAYCDRKDRMKHSNKGLNSGKIPRCTFCHPEISIRIMNQAMMKRNLKYIEQEIIEIDEYMDG